ncbi:MAG: hypothetical protein H6581_06900 [Bacteroidia bacterium]|nr:hypothetical protein [Bacteroidia bacterium]
MKSKDLIRGVAYALDGHGMRHFLNVRTWVINTFSKYDLYSPPWEDIIPDLFFGDDFIEIRANSSKESFQVMNSFVNSLSQSREKDKLAESLTLHRPFDRFRHTLDRLPEVRKEWFAFKADHFRRSAEVWLLENGIDSEQEVTPEDFLQAVEEMIHDRTEQQGLPEDLLAEPDDNFPSHPYGVGSKSFGGD